MQWIGTITHMFEVNQEEYISYYYAFNQLQLHSLVGFSPEHHAVLEGGGGVQHMMFPLIR